MIVKTRTAAVGLALASALTLLASGNAFAQSASPSAAAPPAGPAASTSAPQAADQRLTPAGDIVSTLQANGHFTILLKGLDATNLTSVLKTPGPLTLFAPTDEAFHALPPARLDALLNANPPAELQSLLAYHVINAQVRASKITGTQGPVPSAAGSPLHVNGTGTPLKVNDANITQPDVVVSNGVIHVIDHVLSPSYTPPPTGSSTQ